MANGGRNAATPREQARPPGGARHIPFSLSFAWGRTLLGAERLSLGRGLEVETLTLEATEVELPVDVSRGASQFRDHATRLIELVVRLSPRALETWLEAALLAIGAPIERIHLAPVPGGLEFSAVLSEGSRRARFVADLIFVASEDGRVRVLLSRVHRFGYVSFASESVLRLLGEAVRHLLGELAEPDSVSLPRGLTIELRPLPPLLYALLPSAGFKVPATSDGPVQAVYVAESGELILVAGAEPTRALPPEPAEALDRVLGALAREDAASVTQRQDGTSGEDSFERLRARLDPSGGPEALLERLLALGLTRRDLFAECADLAHDELARRPGSVPALLALAQLEQAEGGSGFEAYREAALQFEGLGQTRRAGFAWLEASRVAEASERGDLVESAFEFLPDDPEVLVARIAILRETGRAGAAARSARRLGQIANAARERLRAELLAADIALHDLEDPVAAKRAYERALQIEPAHPDALEGLAHAIIAQGDPRRATLLLERLIESVEPERAARLAIVLGDLWQRRDLESALSRYRQAELYDPNNVDAILRIVDCAERAERFEVAADAIERALDRFRTPELRLGVVVAGARIARRLGRDEEAIEYDLEALGFDPSSPVETLLDAEIDAARVPAAARRPLGDAFARAGRIAAALELWQLEAEALRRAGEDSGPIGARLEELSRMFPADVRILDACCELAEAGGDLTQVVDALERRLALEPTPNKRAAGLTRLGAVYAAAGYDAEAIGAYEDALELDPIALAALRALVALMRGPVERERLARWLERAALSLPSGAERQEILVEWLRVLLELGQRVAALEAATQLQAEGNVPGELYPPIIETAFALERYVDAERWAVGAERVAETPEQRITAWLHLARAAEGLDDLPRAADALSRVLVELEARGEPSELWRDVLDGLERFMAPATLAGLLERYAENGARDTSAEYALRALRVLAGLGDPGRTDQFAERVLPRFDGEARERLIELWAGIAKHDPRRSARVLRERARVAPPEARALLALEESRLLEGAGLLSEALETLRRAGRRLPGSHGLAARQAELLFALGQGAEAGRAFAHAARLAEGTDEALRLYERAALVFWQIADSEQALGAERALLLATDETHLTPLVSAALTRMMRHAQATDDAWLLVFVHEEWARLSEPAQAAHHRLERARLLVRLGEVEDALEAFRLARQEAPDEAALRRAEAELDQLLGQLGRHEERIRLLLSHAHQARLSGDQVRAYLRAAELTTTHLGDFEGALHYLDAALTVDPENEEVRAQRIELLRHRGGGALVQVLAEEARRHSSPEAQARALLETADELAPWATLSGEVPRPVLLEALGLAREAAERWPAFDAAFARMAEYQRALGDARGEEVALARRLEGGLAGLDRIAVQLRRIALLTELLNSPRGAQAEFGQVLGELEQCSPEALAELEARVERERLMPPGDGSMIERLIPLGLELSETNEDWPTHVALINRWLDLTEPPKRRAELHAKLGEVLEWKLGEGDAAERQYLAALAADPTNRPARAALVSLYLAADRFKDVATNLGVPVLREIWDQSRDGDEPTRVIEVAEALWPMLEPGTPERAEVLLSLADMYRTVRNEAEGAVLLLETVLREGSKAYQRAALERLEVLFLEEERPELYVEVLRRKAQLHEEDLSFARALADLGEALEWRLGDAAGAEREYRAALAVDRRCEPARRRLAELLMSNDRFREVGEELGIDTLREEVDRLLKRGGREANRGILAADAVEQLLPAAKRREWWLWVANHVTEPEERALAHRRVEALQPPPPEPEAPREDGAPALRVVTPPDELESERRSLPVEGQQVTVVGVAPEDRRPAEVSHARSPDSRPPENGAPELRLVPPPESAEPKRDAEAAPEAAPSVGIESRPEPEPPEPRFGPLAAGKPGISRARAWLTERNEDAPAAFPAEAGPVAAQPPAGSSVFLRPDAVRIRPEPVTRLDGKVTVVPGNEGPRGPSEILPLADATPTVAPSTPRAVDVDLPSPSSVPQSVTPVEASETPGPEASTDVHPAGAGVAPTFALLATFPPSAPPLSAGAGALDRATPELTPLRAGARAAKSGSLPAGEIVAKLAEFFSHLPDEAAERSGPSPTAEVLGKIELADETLLRFHEAQSGHGHPFGSGESSVDTLLLLRERAVEQPADRIRLGALLEQLDAKNRAALSFGPQALLEFLDGRSPSRAALPLARPPTRAQLRERLLHPDARGPLADLMIQVAEPLAAVLPPLPLTDLTERRTPDLNSSLSAWVERIAYLSGCPLALEIDRSAGAEIWAEPGEPPLVVIGEELNRSPEPSIALDFSVARIAMLIRLGHLSISATVGEANDWLELLKKVVGVSATRTVPPEIDAAQNLFAARLLDREALREPIQRLLRGPPPDWARWETALRYSADRFALLAVGAPHQALDYVSLREGVSHLAPERRIETSLPTAELARFLISSDYAYLLGELVQGPA